MIDSTAGYVSDKNERGKSDTNCIIFIRNSTDMHIYAIKLYELRVVKTANLLIII